jgi:LytS/YehU family sensor histidine kinase
MCLVFVVMAPYLWRKLGLTRGVGATMLPLLGLYAALGVAIVWALGWGLPWALSMGDTFLTGTESMFVATALFWVGGWGLGRDIELEAGLKRERARVRDLEREAERAQLMALRAHLDTHFLFNTLNAIAEWCREDGETAEKAILKLSSLLRTMLDGVRLESWPLSREFELAIDLFRLHQIRNPSLFTIEQDLPEALAAVQVPPMVLLPLAENAMKHGPSAGHGGEVRLRALAEGEQLGIELENPGAFAGRREGGEGISMVERRLALAYDLAASLEFEAREGGTLARVRVPIALPDSRTPEGRGSIE